MEFLEAILDSAHEKQRARLDWYGGRLDRVGFDETRASFGMENMAQRQCGPLTSHRRFI